MSNSYRQRGWRLFQIRKEVIAELKRIKVLLAIPLSRIDFQDLIGIVPRIAWVAIAASANPVCC